MDEVHQAVNRLRQDAWLQYGLLSGLSGAVTLFASCTAYICIKRRRRGCCRRRARERYRLQDSRVSSTTPSDDAGGSNTNNSAAAVGAVGGVNPDRSPSSTIYEEIELNSGSATASDRRSSYSSSSEDTTLFSICGRSHKVKSK